jgi:hypothetical protein
MFCRVGGSGCWPVVLGSHAAIKCRSSPGHARQVLCQLCPNSAMYHVLSNCCVLPFSTVNLLSLKFRRSWCYVYHVLPA